MKHLMPVLAAAAVALTGSAAWAAVRADSLTISHAWSRPTPAGAPTAVGYLTITNAGPKPDRLVNADSPDAASLTLHSLSNTGGIMRMRAVPEGLVIAPHGSVTLDPNGYHLMFEGLKRPFKAGDRIPAVLHFEHSGAVRVSFDVGDGPKMAGMDMH